MDEGHDIIHAVRVRVCLAYLKTVVRAFLKGVDSPPMKTPKKHKKLETQDNPLAQAFCARITAWRKESGLTLKVASEQLGLSLSLICEYEHCRRFPSVEHLYRISQITGIPAAKFITLPVPKR